MVIATPHENPSKTDLGMNKQNFSSLRAKNKNWKIPAAIVTIGTTFIPFSFTIFIIIFEVAPVGPKILNCEPPNIPYNIDPNIAA